MTETDVLLAGLRHTHSLGRDGCLTLADEIERLNTALTDRDAQIERLTRERDEAIREMSEWAAKAGEAEGRLKASEWPGVVEGWKDRATTAERDLAEARAEVERLRKALELAANRLDRLSLETPHGSALRKLAFQWVAETRAAIYPTTSPQAIEVQP